MRIPIPEIQRQVAPTGGPQRSLIRSVPATGVAELGEAITSVARERQARALQIDQAMDRSRASEKVAQAELDWTKAEIERRQSYDPASGQSHADQVRQDFENYVNRVSATAATDGEREMLRARLQDLRGQVVTRAMGFEASTRAKWRRELIDSTVGARAAAAALDPDQALNLIAEQAAEINASPDVNEVEREPLRASAIQRIAGFAAQTLATRDPANVTAHPIFRYLAPESVPEVLRLASGAQRLVKTQDAADDIMTRGLPMDQAMLLVEREHSGEDERALKVELQHRYSIAAAAQNERQLRIYGTAQLEVEQRGRVTPATWAMLTDAHRAAILNRQQAEARQRAAEAAGRPIKTDWNTYLDLREQAINDPAKFAAVDLKQYVDRIGPAQLEQLVDLKGKTATGLGKAPRDAVSLQQQLTATMQAMRITKPADKGRFTSYVQAEIDAETQAAGKPLTFAQRQAVIDRALLQGDDPDAWLWGTKRMFELTPEQRTRFKPNAATDAPATEIDALNDALRQQGLPQTPANRLALYQRAMQKGTQ